MTKTAFPETTRCWRQLKLLVAEYLILSVMKKDEHAPKDRELARRISAVVADFREHYYPERLAR